MQEVYTDHETKKNTIDDVFIFDSIVISIIDKFKNRAKQGKNKYGVDLDRTDLSLLDYIEHAQQEYMDSILYLEKSKKMIVNYIKSFPNDYELGKNLRKLFSS